MRRAAPRSRSGRPIGGQRAEHPSEVGVQRHSQLDDLTDDSNQRVRQGDQQVRGQIVGIVGRDDGGDPEVGVGQPDRSQPPGRDHVVHGGPGQPGQHLRASASLRGGQSVAALEFQRQQRDQVAGHLMGGRQVGRAVDQQPGP